MLFTKRCTKRLRIVTASAREINGTIALHVKCSLSLSTFPRLRISLRADIRPLQWMTCDVSYHIIIGSITELREW